MLFKFINVQLHNFPFFFNGLEHILLFAINSGVLWIHKGDFMDLQIELVNGFFSSEMTYISIPSSKSLCL